MRDQSHTRSRIQEVALELFTEQGYEATSLRQIAERLGVTKAALYYHFKTKDDIVASFLEDRIDGLEELVTWAKGRPATIETRREFVRRYADMLERGRMKDILRFFERNQTSMQKHPDTTRMRMRWFAILDVLSPPSEPLTARLKMSLALFGLHASYFLLRDPNINDEERAAAALRVALDLIDAAARESAVAAPSS
jgi:AcrR family transcriptional regulator